MGLSLPAFATTSLALFSVIFHSSRIQTGIALAVQDRFVVPPVAIEFPRRLALALDEFDARQLSIDGLEQPLTAQLCNPRRIVTNSRSSLVEFLRPFRTFFGLKTELVSELHELVRAPQAHQEFAGLPYEGWIHR